MIPKGCEHPLAALLLLTQPTYMSSNEAEVEKACLFAKTYFSYTPAIILGSHGLMLPCESVNITKLSVSAQGRKV
jgi:hypothetical protein